MIVSSNVTIEGQQTRFFLCHKVSCLWQTFQGFFTNY